MGNKYGYNGAGGGHGGFGGGNMQSLMKQAQQMQQNCKRRSRSWKNSKLQALLPADWWK